MKYKHQQVIDGGLREEVADILISYEEPVHSWYAEQGLSKYSKDTKRKVKEFQKEMVETLMESIEQFLDEQLSKKEEEVILSVEEIMNSDINSLNNEFPDYIGVHPITAVNPRKAYLETRIAFARDLMEVFKIQTKK